MRQAKIILIVLFFGGVIGGTLAAKYIGKASPGVQVRFLPQVSTDIGKLQDTFVQVAEFAKESVVHITSQMAVRDRWTPFWEWENEAVGSGLIINTDGYIVTNNHVVSGARKLTVKFVDGRQFTAKVIGGDSLTDIAVVKIENPPRDIKPALLGDSDLMRVGDIVLAIGSPYGLDHTVTQGIISAKGRKRGLSLYEDYMQTDAAINPGNSGGALVNLKGEVIGINSAIVTKSGAYSGIGLAIPINIAKWVESEIIKNGKVRRGYLGAQFSNLDEELARRYGSLGDIKNLSDLIRTLGLKDARGAFVVELVPESPAARAGMMEGDVVVEYNGEEVPSADKLSFMIAQTDPGSKATLKISRDGKAKEIAVGIGERK